MTSGTDVTACAAAGPQVKASVQSEAAKAEHRTNGIKDIEPSHHGYDEGNHTRDTSKLHIVYLFWRVRLPGQAGVGGGP
jgi:hypothetical protein